MMYETHIDEQNVSSGTCGLCENIWSNSVPTEFSKSISLVL